MALRFSSTIKTATQRFSALSQREKIIVAVAALGLVLVLCQQGVSLMQEHLTDNRQLITVRKNQLQDLAVVLKRYAALRQRKESLQQTYAQSQMSFEQLSTELDRVVRDAIGSDNYELKKPHPPAPFGFEYEKQEFSLIVKSLTLDQLVKLLYQVEHGGKPIFLSKVDINKSLSGTDFSAVLEIYSISKAAQQVEAPEA